MFSMHTRPVRSLVSPGSCVCTCCRYDPSEGFPAESRTINFMSTRELGFRLLHRKSPNSSASTNCIPCFAFDSAQLCPLVPPVSRLPAVVIQMMLLPHSHSSLCKSTEWQYNPSMQQGWLSFLLNTLVSWHLELPVCLPMIRSPLICEEVHVIKSEAVKAAAAAALC